MIVDGSELGAECGRLLQVVADDLFDLNKPVAGSCLDERREPFMQLVRTLFGIVCAAVSRMRMWRKDTLLSGWDLRRIMANEFLPYKDFEQARQCSLAPLGREIDNRPLPEARAHQGRPLDYSVRSARSGRPGERQSAPEWSAAPRRPSPVAQRLAPASARQRGVSATLFGDPSTQLGREFSISDQVVDQRAGLTIREGLEHQ